MLGDAILAEPGAVIGFAGPRVIKQTLGQDLPEGFQTAEFLLDHGMVDRVVHRARAQADRRPAAAPHERQAGRDGVGVALSDHRRYARRSTTSSRARPATVEVRARAHRGAPRRARRSARPTARRSTSRARTGRAASVATLEACCARKGFEVGEYTSPHLVDFRERISRRRRRRSARRTSSISSSGGRRRSSGSARRSSRRRPRWRSTCSRAQSVDVAVIETGLGGRLDSTNVVEPRRRRRHVDRHRSHRVPRRDAARRSPPRRRGSSRRACRR